MGANSDLNFVLELVDGTILITALSAATFIFLYIADDYRRSPYSPYDYVFHASLAIRLATSLLLLRVGAVLLVGALLSSRFRDQQETSFELALMIFGIVILIFAMILGMWVLTRNKYGEWPWIGTTLVTLAYITGMVTWHHFY